MYFVNNFLSNNEFLFLSTNKYVVGTQKNRLVEMVLLSTHNICQTYVVGTLTYVMGINRTISLRRFF